METRDEQLNTRPEISHKIINDIKSTTPWIKFLAIVGFIYASFMAMASLFMLVASATLRLPVAISLLYAAFAALGFYLLWNLYQYANKLKEFTYTQDMNILEAALGKQKIFFRTYGIVVLIALILVFIVLFFFGSVIMNMLSSYRNSFNA